jgi:hypothetical protein
MLRRFAPPLLAVLTLALIAAPAHAKPVKPSKTVTGVAKLNIGWVYTDEEYGGQHGGRLTVNWSSCAKAGGGFVDFPASSHVYRFRDVPGPGVGSRMSIAGTKFVSQPYIGANATPGPKTITLRCVKDSGKLLGTGKLKVQFVRKPLTFGVDDVPLTLTLPYLIAGQPSVPSVGIDLPACSAPGITSLTATSPAFAPDPTGSRTVTLQREQPTNAQDGGYSGAITGASDTPPGDYPVSITCGTGPIGTGTVTLHAAS